MIIDGLDVQPILVKRHPIVEELHTIDFVYFSITTKFQKSIEPETIVLNRFWTYILFILEIEYIFF